MNLTRIKGKMVVGLWLLGGGIIYTYAQENTTTQPQVQEVNIAGKTDVPEDTVANGQGKKLDEVVVTALGIKRDQKSLGYSVTQIGGDAVNNAKSSNFMNSLSGKVAGLSVQASNAIGGSTNVILRGYKSLTGNNQALFVVDGVPINNDNNNGAAVTGNPNSVQQSRGVGTGYDFGNAASDINPDDIESISVLKGAAASALYGSRAANGVVMITTKKGKVQKNRPIGIFYNVSYMAGLVDKNTLPKYQAKYGGGAGTSYGAGYNAATDAATGKYFNYGNGPLNGVRTPYVPYGEDASYGFPFDPNLLVYQWDSWIPGMPNYGNPTPWVPATHSIDYFFQLSNTVNNNVGFEGGNDKANFRMSYTNFYQTGYTPNNTLQKNTVNVNASYKLVNSLTASAVFNYVNETGIGALQSGYSKNVMSMFREWWQTNTDFKLLKEAYNLTHGNYGWNNSPSGTGQAAKPAYWDNPYFQAYEAAPIANKDRFYGSFSLNYTITPWLSALGRIGYDIYSQQIETKSPVNSVVTPFYARYNNKFAEYNYDLMLTAQKDWGKFDLNAILGTNVRYNKQNSIYATTNGGLITPGFYSLQNGLSAISPPVEYAAQRMVAGYYLNASLGWDDYLYLDLAGRVDQSSTLPKANNTYFYPSIALSFVFSKFLTPIAPWISFGKVRANYAQVGNDAPFASLLNYYTPNYSSSGNTSTTPNPLYNGVALQSINRTLANGTLKPENTRSIEVGLEMQFLKNRIGFDINYYLTNTFNQILSVDVSNTTGYAAAYVNAGNVRNQGVELSINAVPVVTKDFQWNTQFNFYKNWNKVISLYVDAEGNTVNNVQLTTFQGGVSLNATVGHSYGDLRGTTYTYSPNGQKIVNANGYGYVQSDANQVIGNMLPNFKMGWSNTFSYKGISLSFLIDASIGGNIFSTDMYYGLQTGLYPETAGNNDLGSPVRNSLTQGGGYVFQGVIKNSDGTYTPNTTRVAVDGSSTSAISPFGYSYNPRKAFIYDASYIKLRELSVSYAIPQKYLEKTKFIKGCTVAFVAKNLWIIYKNLPYADPEAMISSGNIQGVSVGSLPAMRQFGFRANFTF